MSEKMTLDEAISCVEGHLTRMNRYYHEKVAWQVIKDHLAILPAAVPGTKDDIDAPAYYEIGEASAWAAILVGCREAMLTQRGNAQDAT